MLLPLNGFALKRIFALFVTLPLLFATSSCNQHQQSNKEPESIARSTITREAKPENIALVMKTLTNPFFLEMERGARKAEKDLAISLLVRTAAQETSIQQQIGIVEKLISDKVDAIVIAPGDSVELIPVLKQAQDAGIKVINIDNQLDPAYSKQVGLRDVPYISVDNTQGAYHSVQALTRLISKPTSVAILEGIREAKNAEDRKQGAIKAFNESPQTNIVATETAHWKIDEGYSVTKKIFTDHPDVGAIFCANDMMALGTIKYLQTAGRSDVLVAAYDALDAAKDAIRSGNLVATVDQQAAEQGYKGVLYAHMAINGEKPPLLTYVDTKVITRANVE